MKLLKFSIIAICVLAIGWLIGSLLIKNARTDDYKGLYQAARDSLDNYRVERIVSLEEDKKAKDSVNKQLASDIVELKDQVSDLQKTDIQNQKKHSAINEKLKAIPDRFRSISGNADSIRRAFTDF